MEISSIINQNPWWRDGKNFVDSHLDSVRIAYVPFSRREIKLEKEKIYLILGPRQVGKTVWIKQHIKKLVEETEKLSGITYKQPGQPDRPLPLQYLRGICYLSCDTLTGKSRKELRRAIDFFIDNAREVDCIYLFLDEITCINDWDLTLKELSDSGQAKRMVIVATGSCPKSLKAKMHPGRKFIPYFMKPLNFHEFVLQVTPRLIPFISEASLKGSLSALINTHLPSTNLFTLDNADALIDAAYKILPCKKELDYLFNFYLLTGGYPQVINNYFLNKFHKHTDSIDKEIYADFVNNVLSALRKLDYQEYIIKQTLYSVIKKIGNRYSYNALAQDAENVTLPTLTSYISHLSDSLILNPLLAYNFDKKQPKYKGDKKIYFTDPFVLSAIQSWISGNENGFAISDDFRINKSGYLIETIVAQHLIVAHEDPVIRTPDTFLWFYYNTRELDFVYKTQKNDFLGIETAYQGSPKPSDAARVSQVRKYLMLTKDEYDCAKKDPALCMMPVSMFLSVLEQGERNL